MKYVIALIFCVFMGVMGISLGLGTAVPQINLIAQPVLCPDGEMEHSNSSRKGTGRNRNATYTSTSWTCEEGPGKSDPIASFTVALVAGPVYGLLMFLPLAMLMAIAGRGRRAMAAQRMGAPGYGPPGMGPPGMGPPGMGPPGMGPPRF
jgi:hypothetical protein